MKYTREEITNKINATRKALRGITGTSEVDTRLVDYYAERLTFLRDVLRDMDKPKRD